MINYKVRPAISTKIILEYCKEINLDMPNCFNHINELDDSDFISMHMITNTLLTVENNLENDIFYFDMIRIIEDRWCNFFAPLLKPSTTQCQQLLEFYNVYPGRMASVEWSLVESATQLTLNAKRGALNTSSKYDDLILFNFISKLLNNNSINEKGCLSIALPFSRSFYGKYIDMFTNVTFDEKKMSITANKTQEEIFNKESFSFKKHSIDVKTKIDAAVNMIPTEELSLSSLSFILGTSPRTLQRTLKSSGILVKDIIRDAKFNHAHKILIKNQCNIKKTSLDCGYKNQSSLTKLFSNTTGLTPTEYAKKI